ncbi:MAG: MATE family efflux transporter [Candidatus Bipolaricaulota bacterium]|nr:MATE family efflux transporter [Candidatus Bipolaricaulota bacterium]
MAYPVSLGMISITLLNVVDTAMLGRLGSLSLAAAGISGVAYFAIIFSLAGIGVGVQTLAARRYGEKESLQCGQVLNAGLILGLIAGIPLVLASGAIAKLISPFLSQQSEVASLGAIYLHYRFLGAAFLLLNMVYRGFYNGVGDTRQQLLSAIVVTVSNILLDYGLIFGHLGLPKMGIAGAAIASSIATGLGLVYFVVVSLMQGYRVTYHPYQHFLHAVSRIGPIIRLSVPVMGQRLMANGTFFVFFSIVARIGTLELAASNIIRSVIGLSIMPAIGIGVAAMTLVGQNLGARKPDEAEVFAWDAAKLAAYLMAGIGLTFVAFPRLIFMIYTSDPAVIALGRIPLIFLGLTQAFGGISLVLEQSLQGAGNTRYVMLAEGIVCLLFYLPIAYLLGIHLHLGITGAWLGEIVYWSSLSLLMAGKFRTGTWKTIRV